MQIDINESIEITDEFVARLLDYMKQVFETHLQQEQRKREALQAELDTLKESLDGYVSPDYGMLPVPAVFYERVIELAQGRGISPGVLMMTPQALEHLLQMLEREIL